MTAPLKCRCGGLLAQHGLDRKRRPVCRCTSFCGCRQFREMPAHIERQAT